MRETSEMARQREDEMNYSNPRTEAVIEDWPSGKNRTTATFTVERNPKRGERAVRVTVGKPKVLTFAKQARIVDGDDGKTYILENHGGFVRVMRGTMDYEAEQPIFPSNPRYAELMALFGAP
jgi:hypothetical protein